MTFRKIKIPFLVLGILAAGTTSSVAISSAAGVYNPANDSSPDAMTPGYTGLTKTTAG
ncbi:MAG: hypothetical protein AB8B94_02430 [Hyphomicrobiales bacterium]